MAITTAGGGGSGTGTLAAQTANGVNLFTTPNTTNAIFAVTVTATMPMAPISSAIAQTPQNFTFKAVVGPNANVRVPLYNPYSGVTPVAYAYSYQWVSIVFS